MCKATCLTLLHLCAVKKRIRYEFTLGILLCRRGRLLWLIVILSRISAFDLSLSKNHYLCRLDELIAVFIDWDDLSHLCLLYFIVSSVVNYDGLHLRSVENYL